MHENTTLVPRPPWATAQEVTDPETVTNSRELPARSLAGPSPVALLETWEVVTTRTGPTPTRTAWSCTSATRPGPWP
ncbi:hypothetical protein, partial [Kocuria sp. CNJ-770]|uniref:hypothetical protein n=1 Tax=Kocuria sp. CNJ-770 TaxID=1904964 RepID=UPI000A9AA26F